MASLQGPTPASAEQLAEELKNPNASAIWKRAGDPAEQRRVLEASSELTTASSPKPE
jgi:hypothetical protein